MGSLYRPLAQVSLEEISPTPKKVLNLIPGIRWAYGGLIDDPQICGNCWLEKLVVGNPQTSTYIDSWS